MAYTDSRPLLDPAFDVLKRSFDFTGRSRRMDGVVYYLMVCLLALPLNFLLGILIFQSDSPGLFFGSFSLFAIVVAAMQLPLIAWLVRRLHDHGRSGWWFIVLFAGLAITYFLPDMTLPKLISVVVSVGLLAMVFWPPDYEANRFGPNPRFDEPAASGEETEQL